MLSCSREESLFSCKPMLHRSPFVSPRFSTPEPLESRYAPALLLGLTTNNELLFVDSDNYQTPTPVPITGTGNEEILAIDFRPRDGAVLGLGNAGGLYLIDYITGEATFETDLTADPADGTNPFTILVGADFGFDYDPASNRIRIISDQDQNLLVNPDNGLVTTLEAPSYSGGTPNPAISGLGFTRNFAGSTATTLYGIDAANTSLVTIDGNQQLAVVGTGLGVAATDAAEFEVVTTSNLDGTVFDLGFAALQVGGNWGFYEVDLFSGAATEVGELAAGVNLRGLTAFIPVVFASGGKSAQFFDVDGDLVTIKVSKGSLTPEDFQLIASPFFAEEGQLLRIDLTNNGLDLAEFAKANISITARPYGGFGDGRVNVGYIDASGLDLGTVLVDGDLARITVGDTNYGNGAMKSLTVHSMGVFGNSTQIENPEFSSTFAGSVSTIAVTTDLNRASIQITNGGSLGTLKVGGGIFGGTETAGFVLVDGSISKVTVRGGLLGNDLLQSGSIIAGGQIKSASVGWLSGGDGLQSGALLASGGLGAVTVRQDVYGGDGEGSGAIGSQVSIKSVTIGGDLVGGSGFYSGSIFTEAAATNAGDIGNITIKGSFGARDGFTGIISDARIGAIKISQDVTGGVENVRIIAEGLVGADTNKEALAIKSLSIGGNVTYLDVLVGYAINGDASHAAVQIGAVSVKGDWYGSNLVVGVEDLDDDGFGDGDDQLIDGGDEFVLARIASITIAGQAIGSFGEVAPGGFVAEDIGKFRVADASLRLEPDLEDFYYIGATGNLVLREYSVSFPI